MRIIDSELEGFEIESFVDARSRGKFLLFDECGERVIFRIDDFFLGIMMSERWSSLETHFFYSNILYDSYS